MDKGNLKMELSVLKEVRHGTDLLKNLHLKKINKEILFYSYCAIVISRRIYLKSPPKLSND